MTQATHPKFWMVWSPQGDAPTKMHATFKSAEAEVFRLARLNPGRQFFLLSAKRGVIATPEGETRIRIEREPKAGKATP